MKVLPTEPVFDYMADALKLDVVDKEGKELKGRLYDLKAGEELILVTEKDGDKDVVKEMALKGGTEFDDEVIKALVLCHRNGTLYGAAANPPE